MPIASHERSETSTDHSKLRYVSVDFDMRGVAIVLTNFCMKCGSLDEECVLTTNGRSTTLSFFSD
jgi:hypothetical protein